MTQSRLWFSIVMYPESETIQEDLKSYPQWEKLLHLSTDIAYYPEWQRYVLEFEPKIFDIFFGRRVYFSRHPQTELQELDVMRGGEVDDSLTPNGIIQAEHAVQDLLKRFEREHGRNKIPPILLIWGPHKRHQEVVDIWKRVLPVTYSYKSHIAYERINDPEFSMRSFTELIATLQKSEPERLIFSEKGELVYILGQGESFLDLQARARAIIEEANAFVAQHSLSQQAIIIFVGSASIEKFIIGEANGLGAEAALNMPGDWSTGETVVHMAKYSGRDLTWPDKRAETGGRYASMLEKRVMDIRRMTVDNGTYKYFEHKTEVGTHEQQSFKSPKLTYTFFYPRKENLLLDSAAIEIFKNYERRGDPTKLIDGRPQDLSITFGYFWNGKVLVHIITQNQEYIQNIVSQLPAEAVQNPFTLYYGGGLASIHYPHEFPERLPPIIKNFMDTILVDTEADLQSNIPH